MGFLVAFVQMVIKFAIFIGIALAGVYCGKKYRQGKDAKVAAGDASSGSVTK